MKQELNWLKQKIKETEEELKKIKITLATAPEYSKLIEIHKELYSLLYFKLHQEETYLIK